jgi:hypothetical protein
MSSQLFSPQVGWAPFRRLAAVGAKSSESAGAVLSGSCVNGKPPGMDGSLCRLGVDIWVHSSSRLVPAFDAFLLLCRPAAVLVLPALLPVRPDPALLVVVVAVVLIVAVAVVLIVAAAVVLIAAVAVVLMANARCVVEASCVVVLIVAPIAWWFRPPASHASSQAKLISILDKNALAATYVGSLGCLGWLRWWWIPLRVAR